MFNSRQNSAPQSILELLNNMIPNYGALNNRASAPSTNNGGWSGGLWNGNGLWNGTGLPANSKPTASAGGAAAPPASPTGAPANPFQDSVNVFQRNSTPAPWANDPAGFYGGQYFDPSQIPVTPENSANQKWADYTP